MLAAATIAAPALADPIKQDEYYSNHSLGCMLLRECNDGVKQVFSLLDISSEYPNTESYTPNSDEFNRMLTSLNQVGVKVFLADSKYFPALHLSLIHI